MLLGYPPLKQIRDVLPCLVAGALMAAVVWWLGLVVPVRPALLLCIQGCAGGGVYIGCCLLFRIGSFHTLVREVANLVAARRTCPV